MSVKTTSPTYAKYFAIWAGLIILLVLGAFVPSLPIPKTVAVLLILFVSLIKAILVVLFYMHMKSEKLVPLWVVAVSPFFLIVLAAGLILIGLSLA